MAVTPGKSENGTVAKSVPADAGQRVMDGRRTRLEADGDRRTAAVSRLLAEHATRRTALLRAENEARLREYMASRQTEEARTSGQASEERVAASLAFARELGVDLEALRRLNGEFSDRISAALELLASPDSAAAAAEPPPSSAVFTSWGSWDSGYQIKYWNCKGRTVASRSYLDPPINQTGGQTALQVIDPGDLGALSAWRENGFLIDYTPPVSGRLIVTTYLQCVIDDHFISTWDEWGWSSYKGNTREYGVVETYSNWDDWSPNEEFYTTFVSGLSSKATNGGPGLVRMYLPGQTRAWVAVSGQAVPAGVPMLLYVANKQFVNASCNDVETFIGINSAWRVSKITGQHNTRVDLLGAMTGRVALSRSCPEGQATVTLPVIGLLEPFHQSSQPSASRPLNVQV